MRCELCLSLVVLGWLALLSYWDVRQQPLPHAVTTSWLVGIGGWRILAPLDGSGAGRGVMLFLLAGFLLKQPPPFPQVYLLTAVGLGLQSGPEAATVAGTWLVAVFLLAWGAWSGGDAKIVMILSALWPDVRLSICLLLALLLGSFIVLGWRYRHGTLMVLHQTMARLQEEIAPCASQATPAPLVPWLGLGTLGYVLWGVL